MARQFRQPYAKPFPPEGQRCIDSVRSSAATFLFRLCNRFWVLATASATALLAALILGWPSQPFRFLAGQSPVVVYDRDFSDGWRIDRCYAFEADFDDVCGRAAAELVPLGFVQRSDDWHFGWRAIQFERPADPFGGFVTLFQDMEYKRRPAGDDFRAEGFDAPGLVSVQACVVKRPGPVDRMLIKARQWLGF